jgi:sulfoxide reductase catalytic subunit YedY
MEHHSIMKIRKRRGWELPDSQATPEGVFLDRRVFMAGVGAAAAAGGIGTFAVGTTMPAVAADDALSSLLPPVKNAKYTLDRALTPEKTNETYNNFYEFGTSKYVSSSAQDLKTRPWTVKIDGLVAKPMELDFDDLVRKVTLEERLYRHRCVEAWSMTIPWDGFPLAALIALANPTSDAKYVQFETGVQDGPGMGGFYPWPYTEGLTMAEAMNELAFLAVGTYGKVMPKVNGAPIRLAVPWKYGFKSIKSINRISFVKDRPQTFWEQLQSSEYGFWANVNPAVPHPRWSQAQERELSTGKEVPTLIYNGYGEFVADIYKDIKGQQLFM